MELWVFLALIGNYSKLLKLVEFIWYINVYYMTLKGGDPMSKLKD